MGVILLGLLVSIVLGSILARPLKQLEEQFSLMKVLILDNVKLSSSVFKEIQNIFNSLEEMLLWLQEIKTFIPDHVLEDIQSSDPKMCCSPPLLTSRQHASMRSSVTKNSVSSCQSAGRESSTSKRPKFLRALSKTSGVGSSSSFGMGLLFQMGLQKKLLCVACRIQRF